MSASNLSMRLEKFALLICASFFLSGCGSKENYPDAFGVYYHDGKQWVELGKNTGSITKQVPADVQFLLHDKLVTMVGGSEARLTSGRYVRNEVPRTWGSQAVDYANAKKTNKWNIGNSLVEAQIFPVKNRPEMVLVKPRASLPSGVYSIDALGKNLEAFYVGGNTLMISEASEFCFDQIAGHIMGNPGEKFVPCRESDAQLVGSNSAQTPTPQPMSAPPPLLPNPQLANTPSPPLNAQWFGKWKSIDGKKVMEISTNKMSVIDAAGKRTPSDPDSKYDLAWSPTSEINENQFGYPGGSISIADISALYELALSQFKRDPRDFSVSEADLSRRAIAAISAGNYKVVRGYLGGDCGTWDWIIDKDKLLEISQCKYAFNVRAFNRAK